MVPRALVLLALSSTALAQGITAPVLSEAEKKQLDANEVLVRELTPTDGKGVSAETIGVVDAAPADVWPVVRDCEHFSKFLPNTKTSRRMVVDGESMCFDEISLPFPLMNMWAETKSTVVLEPAGSYQRRWAFTKGTYLHNTGAWTVLPWGTDGKKSLVIYLIDSDPKMIIPTALIRAAQTGALPKVITGVRRRVLELKDGVQLP